MENLPCNVKDIQDLRARRLRPANADSRLVCLNFKVPMRIRQQFKITAASHNMTMTELLLRLVDNFVSSPVEYDHTIDCMKIDKARNIEGSKESKNDREGAT